MTQATSSVLSPNITLLDTLPLVRPTSGQGAESAIIRSTDYIAVTTGMLAAGQYWRTNRIPTRAVIKRVLVMPDAILDTNASQTLALDFGVAFSDSTIDGTPVSLQSLIPTSANTGATTPPATYTSPNIIFGTVTLSGNNAQFPPKINGILQFLDITYGKGSVLYNSLPLTETPLYRLLGFKNAQGTYADPGGFFDLFTNVSAGAATAHAGNIAYQIDYAIAP